MTSPTAIEPERIARARVFLDERVEALRRLTDEQASHARVERWHRETEAQLVDHGFLPEIVEEFRSLIHGRQSRIDVLNLTAEGPVSLCYAFLSDLIRDLAARPSQVLHASATTPSQQPGSASAKPQASVAAALELLDKIRAELESLANTSNAALLPGLLRAWEEVYRPQIAATVGLAALAEFDDVTRARAVARRTRGSRFMRPADRAAVEVKARVFLYKDALRSMRRAVERYGEEYIRAGPPQQVDQQLSAPGSASLSMPRGGAQPDPRKVFVVHGRNEKANSALFALLRSLGLEPIEWSKAVTMTGKGAPYIGEVLNRAFAEAKAVVVLLTGDDLAHLHPALVQQADLEHERQPTPQARANVLFEAGMAFGSHPEQTVLVELGGPLRPFSDVFGRHAVRLDDSAEKRNELAERLRAIGCAVDTTGRQWLKEGDFAAAILTPPLDTGTSASGPLPGGDTEALPEEALRLLRALGQVTDPPTDEQFASATDFPMQKVRYLMETLEARGLVDVSVYGGGIEQYHLTKSGREFLVGRGWL